MRAAGVPVLERTASRRATERRPAAAGQGVRRWWRPRDARRPHARRPARRDREGRGRGRVGVRRRHRLRRAVRRARPPRRGAGRSATGDGVLVLGERDCSIQRRHQKVVEEAPAPDLADGTRSALHEAARGRGGASTTAGAGTVEFLYDAEHRALLLPGDEHPPPGRAPGHRAGARRRPRRAAADAWPRAAALDLRRDRRDLRARDRGAAVRRGPGRRLAAAERAADALRGPGVAGEFDLLNRPGLRVDSGFESGSEVSTHYDAMLAKVIAWAPTRAGGRAQARRRAVAGAAPRRGHQPRPAGRDPAARGLPVRRGQHRLPRAHRGHRVEHRPATPDPHLLFAAAVALAERRPVASTRAARRPGRLAQRGLPAAAHRARRRRRASTSSSGTAAATATPRPTPTCRVLSALADRGACSRSTSIERRGSQVAVGPGDAVAVDGPVGSRAAARRTPLRRPGRRRRAGVAARADAGHGRRRPRRGRRRGHRRPAGARARGDEDAAHDHRAHRRRRHRPRRRGPAGGGGRRARRRVRQPTSPRRTSHEQLHRVRGAPDPAPGGGEAGRDVRPRVLHPPGAQPARRPPTCGWRSARPATSASTSPRSTAAGAAASATSRRSARSSPRRAARC